MTPHPTPPQTLGLVSFKPVLPTTEEPAEANLTRITLQASPVKGVVLPVSVLLPTEAFGGLRAAGFTLFGARAGHVVTARPEAPQKVRRIHTLLTGAGAAHRPLYRDGNPANLSRANLGFMTHSGYPWWLVPRAGENDPSWNREGLPLRSPEAISEAREVISSPRPAYSPSTARLAQRDAEQARWRRDLAAAGRPLTRMADHNICDNVGSH
jgi:hypothetical protein